ncbi:MAG: ATP-dependent helicase [Candidatus Dormibacterales bacterium]
MTEELGREQRAAAAIGGGPIRVVAGAGTGKTAVIAERYRRLVSAGVDPDSILVMTFTERAAGEMRQRIEQAIGAAAPAVGTFHALALGWLRAEGRKVGVPAGFQIIAGAERWILARELMWKLGDAELTGDERPDDLVAPVLNMLERMKQELVPLARLESWGRASDDLERAPLMHACARLFRAYELECRRRRLVDFDDLVMLSVRMLEKDSKLLAGFRQRYRHVLVDEYQDLNLGQERLVELIAAGSAPFVVGDDDQSIYRFRGASRASLERFLTSFPTARTITLGRNRRSSRRIVAAASALIAGNAERIKKELVSGVAGPAVEIWVCPDGESEAFAIASEADDHRRANGAPGGVAVLCRTNAIARPIAAALASLGVPHRLVGGHGFFDRPEVRDLIALLRVLRDPADEVALTRALARPPATLDQGAALRVLRNRGSLSPIDAVKEWAPAAELAGLLEQLSLAARQLDVRDLFFELMERTGFIDALVKGLETSAAGRASANVSRFAELIAEFCETASDRSLANYMSHLDLVLLSGEDEETALEEPNPEAIQVMTIHQAKGLEFDTVFVPSLVEGRLPQTARSPRFELPAGVLEPLVRGREDVIAEERRLLYVAMTRARRHLYLSRAGRYEGGRSWRESRFLEEVRSAGGRTTAEFGIEACPEPGGKPMLAPTPGDPQLSFSAASAYRDCPKQYWYRYEQRLVVPQSAEAVQGVILHEVLRRCGERRRNGDHITAATVRSVHQQVWEATEFPDNRRAPTFKRVGAAQLDAYIKRGGLAPAPVYLEEPFTMELEGWSLRGVIDRIDRTDNGWRIIDYKSGRPTTRRRRDLQLALYALGARAVLGLDPLELEVVYLAAGESIPISETAALMSAARADGAQVADAVRAGRFEPTPERRRCRLCPYRLACAEAL